MGDDWDWISDEKMTENNVQSVWIELPTHPHPICFSFRHISQLVLELKHNRAHFIYHTFTFKLQYYQSRSSSHKSSKFTFKFYLQVACLLSKIKWVGEELLKMFQFSIILKCQVEISLKIKTNHHDHTTFTEFGGNRCLAARDCQRLSEIVMDFWGTLIARDSEIAKDCLYGIKYWGLEVCIFSA